MARDKSSLATYFKNFEYIGNRNFQGKQHFGERLSLFIFPYLSLFSQLVVVGSSAYAVRNLTRETRVLAIYFAVSFVLTVIQLLLALNGINNLWIYQFFCPVQFVLLAFVFFRWNENSFVGIFIRYSVPTFVLAWCVSAFLVANPAATLTYADPISAVVLILVSSYTLVRLDRLEGSSVLDVPAFWISAATIAYFGGTLVFSALSISLLRASIQTMQIAWSTQSVVSILANLVYAGGFLCLRRKT